MKTTIKERGRSVRHVAPAFCRRALRINALPGALLIALAWVGQVPAQEADERVVLVPWTKVAKEAPLFFSATAEVNARAGLETVTSEQKIQFRIHQGKPETLTLALNGTGEITEVTGAGLRDWSLRVAENGARFLDIRPALVEAKLAAEPLEVLVKTRVKVDKETAGLVLPGPGNATGFSLTATIAADPGVDLRIIQADGLIPVEGAPNRKFVATGLAAIGMRISPAGTDVRGLEIIDTSLGGRLSEDGNSMSFRVTGTARSAGEGSAIELLSGGAALTDGVSGDGWHVVLRKKDEAWVHDLVAEREGEFPVDVGFEVPVTRRGDWRVLDFALPAGVVVPVTLDGLAAGVSFDRSLAVVPLAADSQWRGFLPASGRAAMAWHLADRVADGTLFFSSSETTDVRVGSGLLRQMTVIDLRVLQGKLGELTLSLDGPGEVLSVAGGPVLGWNVREDGGKRSLEVRLSRPIEGAERLVIEAQAALGGFPVKAESLRMVPAGALRHSGWLRVANDGAVRIEVADAKGLIQLAPGQFPGGVDERLRQVFVYRFPSAEYGYAVNANQVLPEVGLTEVTLYELAESDRRIAADLELDIREAPLREWEMEIPADHAVASVTGAEVADYALAGDAKDGKRKLKILFKQAVANRQLISVRLEKNEAAKAGPWELQPLGFPGVKSRRGYVGAVAAAGFRLGAGKTTGVAEVPTTFFPKKTSGLQQAFRLREDKWSVGLTVEALGQSIQADVFHLYSLKSGAVYGSVLMNFFVVGAPATEWKVSVPEGIGNIDVTGQNVGRDWRRDGNTLIIPLSRPVLGTGTVLLTFEQPMNPRGGSLSPGEVSPVGVQGERGFVQVVSPLQVNHKSVSEGALMAIDPTELPAEFRLLSSAPTLGVWQYTARDFKIAMDIEWFEPGDTVGQVVDFQRLTSRVSRDGQWVTDARIFVKTRGRSALRMVFPKDAVLWEAKVDGEAVNARADGGETLVPLPSRLDPNQAVEVSLRYGARAERAGHPRLTAPRLDAPVVINEWTISGDEGRQLIPLGGTADLVRPVLAESGWEWLAKRRGGVLVLLAAGAGALLLGMGNPAGARKISAVVLGLAFVGVAVALAMSAHATSRAATAVLEYAAPVVAADGEVAVELGNVPEWLARTGWGVWLGFVLGTAAAVYGLYRWDRWWLGCGLVLVVAAFLSIRGGAALFFGIVALVGLFWLVPRIYQLIRTLRKPKAPEAVAAALVMACMLPWDARAAEVSRMKPAESMVHDWQIRDGRLHGSVDVTLRGEAGDRFLLLREPAVLTSFEGAGLRVVKLPIEGGNGYGLISESAGRLTGRAVFEMPLADPSQGWEIPGGPAAMRKVTLHWDQGGWEFTCPGAAKVQALPDLPPNQSGALLVLGPVDAVKIQPRPKQRDSETEETKFFAEAANLFLPGPGVVNGRHLVTIRPAQGRVTSLVMKVPAGFTVSDVLEGPVGAWRFDPGKRELRISVEPAQNAGFAFTIDTQRGAGALPMDLELEPVRVEGAAGEVGLLGIAFGEEVQPESVDVAGLSRVNPEDFNNNLLPRTKEGQPLALLQHAFRYGSGDVKAALKVTAVAPELRAESWQLVSLGEDRLVVATDLAVTITRSGVFRLDLDVPEGLEIESATGEGLSHWTEGKAGGKRIVTFHLSGKTMGRRQFSLTLTGRPTGAQEDWQVPRLSLRDASRETGVLTVVPERGLQVRAVGRRNVSQMDPRELADGPQETSRAAARPGALAYRLLQSDWSLGLSISRLDPWVTARVFHDATIREGQLLTRVHIGYRIENAAVKSQRLRIPGLDDTSAATVRATGSAVADIVRVDGEKDLWEIRFQRGLAGETDVELEFQRPGRDGGGESVEPIVLENVRQVSYFVVVRAGGRLELEAGALPRGWQRTDWAVVQSTLGRAAGSAAPGMSFRVSDPEGPLPVLLKRHQLADLRKLRVSEGTLTTLLSADGDALTAVNMRMQLVGKSTLRLRLPDGAELFNVFVNDEGATLVREGGDWLFHVFPSPEVGRQTEVRFVYSAALRGRRQLEGPVLDVPMENLTWRVLVPEGWRLAGHAGDFDLKQQQAMGTFRLEDYQSFVRGKRATDAKSAVALLDQANAWLEAGDQEKASLALGNAARSGQLDAASGEDARVQLRQLKTQQAMLGLNTRRQKLVLDNRLSAPQQAENPQLDRAAQVNPVLRGAYNYDPKQFDRFLEGNTADENTALKEIANRIVTQQLAAEPAPAALDVTLPERGTVLSFGRSVQVDGDRPMSIELKLKRASGGFAWLAVLLCLLTGAMGVAVSRRSYQA
jgi:hypothetical protein